MALFHVANLNFYFSPKSDKKCIIQKIIKPKTLTVYGYDVFRKIGHFEIHHFEYGSLQKWFTSENLSLRKRDRYTKCFFFGSSDPFFEMTFQSDLYFRNDLLKWPPFSKWAWLSFKLFILKKKTVRSKIAVLCYFSKFEHFCAV